MNTKSRALILTALLGLLLTAVALLAARPTQAARPAPAADRASLGDV